MSPPNMDESTISGATCLSSDEHGCDIKDHLLHYLGCIEFCDQAEFFTPGFRIWKQEAKHQQEVLHHSSEKAKELTEQKRKSWEDDCKNELKRIGFLRKQLSKDSKDKHLVDRVEESLDAWRKCSEYENNIESVRQKRRDKGKGSSSTPSEASRDEDYDLEKDITVPIIQFNDGKPYEVEGRGVWNKFPNQKTMLGSLLNGEDNLLRHNDSSPDRLIRYFHIPSNNMDWIERAIGRYFGEERPDYHAIHRELKRKKKTKAYMILRDQYWRGQLHGGEPYSPVHARHMKPMCTTISSDLENIKYLHRNMVLFMPYLHWDTSRKNEQFTTEIEDIMADAKDNELRRKKKEKDERSEHPNGQPVSQEPSSWASSTRKQKSKIKVATMSRLLKLIKEEKLIKSPHDVDGNGRVRIRNCLGQFLIDAARLYEGISNYRDKKLLRQYISTDPPLHPRRTLDQAYHWTLNSTRERDRDQVVYRHTTIKLDRVHKYDLDTGRWQEHDDFDIRGDCKDCRRNIQKLSRIIMVDQLWMWVLDSRTIITCFPKQYGSNTKDNSAVYRSIRTRIQDTGSNWIRTPFDLGLIVIDECAKTLFDRTKPLGWEPQVLDTFHKAIKHIMHKRTLAFEKLWLWADNASKMYKSNSFGDTPEHHISLIDVHAEGRLDQEIKDIVEELDIIMHITKVQKEMLSSFITNAENLLDPLGKFGKNPKREIIGSNLWEKSNWAQNNLAGYHDESNELFEKNRQDYNWFKLNSDELLQNMLSRMDELEDLRNMAIHTSSSVRDLIELKQQQASVFQAWQTGKQSEESIRQGRSVMMFTLVTIIFLPLSFMSSVFGMNNMEITSENWSIHREFLYMFTISAAVIILSLLLAFGGWIRASLCPSLRGVIVSNFFHGLNRKVTQWAVYGRCAIM
ncbi:hypothetical protein F4815DRAFT_166294 [Daldinia loculata]|nr:hypothetical protein F4815DRAFT_166294 [Daldinia loculata]